MAGQAFRRSNLIMAAISALSGMPAGSDAHFRAMQKIPVYFSRGKGGKKARNKTNVHMATVRAARAKHNKSIRS